jgi:LysR family transcriptional regulator, glycine cleavage system transcriptional activator
MSSSNETLRTVCFTLMLALTRHKIDVCDKEKLSRYMASISRIKAIQAFEVTARKGSFVAAATELNVTPAAVGQQVRALESWLGVPLFRRLEHGSKRLVATEAAEAALLDLRDGFARIESGVRKLRERRASDVITVTASQAFVAKWLLPRLEDFSVSCPRIDVRLEVTDRLVDLAHGEADIAVRCGAGRWSGISATRLMDEEVFPVCSPELLHAIGGLRDVRALAKQNLIHDATMKNEMVFPTWEQWFAQTGVRGGEATRGLKINSSAAVIQAAINGQGFVLARRVLVADDLKNKRLVRLFPAIQWPVRWSYFVVCTQSSLAKPSIKAFHDWLVETAHASSAVLD